MLHTVRYGESSLIIHAYTQHFGRISLMAKGVRSEKRPGRVALLQPLQILSMEIYRKPTREIQILKEFYPETITQIAPSDPVKNAITLFIAELLYKVLREEEPNEAMFRFLSTSLLQLMHLQSGKANFHLYFAVHLTRYLGFFPTENFDELHCFFDGITGKFVEKLNAPVTAMPADESALLTRLMKISPDNLGNISISGVQRSRFLDELMKFFQIHLEGMGKIKSLDVLREVFSGTKE